MPEVEHDPHFRVMPWMQTKPHPGQAAKCFLSSHITQQFRRYQSASAFSLHQYRVPD